jgi:hypothetical protein
MYGRTILNLTGYNAILRVAVNMGRDEVEAHIGPATPK